MSVCACVRVCVCVVVCGCVYVCGRVQSPARYSVRESDVGVQVTEALLAPRATHPDWLDTMEESAPHVGATCPKSVVCVVLIALTSSLRRSNWWSMLPLFCSSG